MKRGTLFQPEIFGASAKQTPKETTVTITGKNLNLFYSFQSRSNRMKWEITDNRYNTISIKSQNSQLSVINNIIQGSNYLSEKLIDISVNPIKVIYIYLLFN